MAQYSALPYVFNIWQNSEKWLISNVLRFIVTCLLMVALWVLSHMARHSFGTLTLTAGIPIESIARIMGHTNIDSTQVYAQVTDRKISSDMDRLMERRKSADAAGKETAD